MVDSIKLFFAFVKVSMLTQMEYRMAYAVRSLGKLFHWGGSLVVLAIMLARFQSIGTWNAYEVLLLYAINNLTYAIAATFTMPIHEISSRIRDGTVDSILTRPANPMYLIMCQQVSAGYTVNYALGIGVIVFAAINLQVQITLVSVLLLVLSIIGGILIHAAALIATGVPSFWVIKSRALTSIFYDEASRFVDYPLNIYSYATQFILTFLLPYAFISFYPAGLFLGKTDESIFGSAIYFFPLLVGVVCFALAYKFWTIGLNAYESTGS